MDDPLINRQLANFRIERLIGRGGMAQVYYGWDTSLHRPVAVKVIDARFRGDPSYAKRFVQEARTVATWHHENIVQVHYADEQDGFYYFAMEFIDGLDLGEILAQHAADGELIPHEEVLHIGRAVAAALDYAHQRGVIHRDVKPSNVMVGKDGRVTLTDFGLALDMQQGTIGETFGSPRYIAPEQARRSADAVPQSDLYAMGVILYQMLTGSVPFDDPSPTSIALQHLTLTPPAPRTINPNLNPAVEQVLLKALSKSPLDRYQSGQALMDDLENALRNTEPVIHPSSASLSGTSVAERVASDDSLTQQGSVRPGRGRFRPWQLVGAGLLLFICLFALAAGVIFLSTRGDEDERAELATSTSAQLETVSPPTAMATFTPEAAALAPTQQTTAPPTTAAPTQQVTVTPTAAAPTISPTTSAEPSASPTVLPTATILYPNGRPLTLFYDPHSFYVWNPPGEAKINVQFLTFESMDETGAPAGNRFDGWRWSQFYPYLEPGNCVRIEMLVAPSYLRPSQCRSYNAQVSSEAESDFVFWVERSAATQFRVLWDDQEIGRCQIGTQSCEVFLP